MTDMRKALKRIVITKGPQHFSNDGETILVAYERLLCYGYDGPSTVGTTMVLKEPLYYDTSKGGSLALAIRNRGGLSGIHKDSLTTKILVVVEEGE